MGTTWDFPRLPRPDAPAPVRDVAGKGAEPPVTALRSRIMSAIRGKDTKPEMLVRRHLHAAGLRFSLHRRDLPGRPDVVLRKHRAVVLVHGCFWHGHDCKAGRIPKTRTDWWKAKIERNRERDAGAKLALEGKGWRVFEVWECRLRETGTLPDLVRAIRTVALRVSHDG